MSLKNARRRRFKFYMENVRLRIMHDFYHVLRSEFSIVRAELIDVFHKRIRWTWRFPWGWRILFIRDPEDRLRHLDLDEVKIFDEREYAVCLMVAEKPMGEITQDDLPYEYGGLK